MEDFFQIWSPNFVISHSSLWFFLCFSLAEIWNFISTSQFFIVQNGGCNSFFLPVTDPIILKRWTNCVTMYLFCNAAKLFIDVGIWLSSKITCCRLEQQTLHKWITWTWDHWYQFKYIQNNLHHYLMGGNRNLYVFIESIKLWCARL